MWLNHLVIFGTVSLYAPGSSGYEQKNIRYTRHCGFEQEAANTTSCSACVRGRTCSSGNILAMYEGFICQNQNNVDQHHIYFLRAKDFYCAQSSRLKFERLSATKLITSVA